MGRKQFEQVVAAAPREYMTMSYTYSTDPVDVQQNEKIDIFAPPNMVGELVGFRVDIEKMTPAPTSGNHTLYVMYDIESVAENIDLMQCQGDLGTDMSFRNNYWNGSGTLVPEPSEIVAQGLAIKGIQFDDSTAFSVSYFNKSDAVMTAGRRYEFTFILREIS